MTNEAPRPDGEPPAGGPASDVPDRFTVDFSGLTLLGIYRVEEKIAEGGMGSIYSGRDENLGMRVVIKVPHVKFLSEPGFRPRFAREIKELVRLAHPHIARILAQGEHEDVPFFVLQYLGGGTLEERMEASEGPLPQDDFVPWMRTMATTLDFVHARGTIHRDVKPANILFDEEGHVFLSDFGVAKVLEAEDANLTDMGTGIGSPKYMAPEQGFGGDLTPAADQYALASMLYECLADQPPFTQGSAIEILVQKSAAPPQALGELVPDLPAAAADVVMRGILKAPEERYASCRAFMDAFDVALAPAPEIHAAPAAPVRKSKVVAFLVGGLLLFLGLLLLLVVGVLLRGGGYVLLPGEGAVNRIGEFEVKLVEAGAEPQRALRYRWTDMGEDALTLDYDQRVVISVKRATGLPRGAPKARPVPPVVRDDPRLTFQVACDLDAASAEEDLALRWRVTGFARGAETVTVDPTTPRADAIKKALRGARADEDVAYGALAGEARYSPNGLLRTHGLKDGLQIPASSHQQLEVIAWVLRTLPIPFPVEPVGVGAVWEVTEVAKFMGMRLRHTKRYELLALDGDRVEVKASVTQIANEQELKLLETGDAHIKAKLLALTGRGQSTAVVHLDHAAPLSSSFRMRLDMEVEYSEMAGAPPGLVVPGGMVIDLEINLARR